MMTARIPDYLITQFNKVLQQGLLPLLNESDDDKYPSIPRSQPSTGSLASRHTHTNKFIFPVWDGMSHQVAVVHGI